MVQDGSCLPEIVVAGTSRRDNHTRVNAAHAGSAHISLPMEDAKDRDPILPNLRTNEPGSNTLLGAQKSGGDAATVPMLGRRDSTEDCMQAAQLLRDWTREQFHGKWSFGVSQRAVIGELIRSAPLCIRSEHRASRHFANASKKFLDLWRKRDPKAHAGWRKTCFRAFPTLELMIAVSVLGRGTPWSPKVSTFLGEVEAAFVLDFESPKKTAWWSGFDITSSTDADVGRMLIGVSKTNMSQISFKLTNLDEYLRGESQSLTLIDKDAAILSVQPTSSAEHPAQQEQHERGEEGVSRRLEDIERNILKLNEAITRRETTRDDKFRSLEDSLGRMSKVVEELQTAKKTPIDADGECRMMQAVLLTMSGTASHMTKVNTQLAQLHDTVAATNDAVSELSKELREHYKLPGRQEASTTVIPAPIPILTVPMHAQERPARVTFTQDLSSESRGQQQNELNAKAAGVSAQLPDEEEEDERPNIKTENPWPKNIAEISSEDENDFKQKWSRKHARSPSVEGPNKRQK
ncbi:hypothetical protein GQ53DRAFT_821234 [Thozetella sp. PMI_491]|nr:hypothetical protein GQ53DRAFT_821234 [Thozetella sp. PMI_491]